MSTRACYIFSDECQPDIKTFEGHVVFKHHDGYPSGAIEFLDKAKKLAWPLPRYEADEFAAAFVAANKEDPGGIRLFGFGPQAELISDDSEYIYLIAPDKAGEIVVRGYGGSDSPIFIQPLAKIIDAVITEEDE